MYSKNFNTLTFNVYVKKIFLKIIKNITYRFNQKSNIMLNTNTTNYNSINNKN